ncbi:GAF domain-containing SpoIIE family protein phosphatase [Thermopolyspora sp. NPDC052614]|uniref:PP2C family protein-serine/threonine phosphatase n=1 Tax=Thermopolyspora sp. NPDC052614 TaxID=3155682 RepID=UPI0034291A96
MDAEFAQEIADQLGRDEIKQLMADRPFLAVPLLARDNLVVGLIIFTRNPGSEPFLEQDVALAEELAGRTGISIDNARLYARERRTALTLQSSLLPKELAKPLGLEIASSYLPASDPAGVGGDWFDVIPLSGFRVALVVGDVMGHGIRAAATMGQLRTAARTLASLDLPPAEVLARLNQMMQDLDDSQLTTCVYATYDPVTNECVLARAGHLPPILLHPGGRTELIDVPGGLPLGIGRDAYRERAVTLPRGCVLVLYTDGLVENRYQDIDAGINIFRAMLSGARCDLKTIRASIESNRRVGDDRDDMALLAAKVRGLPPDRLVRWTLSAGPRTGDEAARLVRETLRLWHLDHAAESGEQLVRDLIADCGVHERESIEIRLLRGDTLVYEVAAPAVPVPPSLPPDHDWDPVPPRASWSAYRSGTRWAGDGRIHWCEQNIGEAAVTL